MMKTLSISPSGSASKPGANSLPPSPPENSEKEEKHVHHHPLPLSGVTQSTAIVENPQTSCSSLICEDKLESKVFHNLVTLPSSKRSSNWGGLGLSHSPKKLALTSSCCGHDSSVTSPEAECIVLSDEEEEEGVAVVKGLKLSVGSKSSNGEAAGCGQGTAHDPIIL